MKYSSHGQPDLSPKPPATTTATWIQPWWHRKEKEKDFLSPLPSWSYSRQHKIFKLILLQPAVHVSYPFTMRLLRSEKGGREGGHPMSVWRLKLHQWSGKIFSYEIFSDIPNTGTGYCLHNRTYLGITNTKGFLTITHSQPRNSDSG